MREGITVEVSAADRARLEAIVVDRNTPQKHAWRAHLGKQVGGVMMPDGRVDWSFGRNRGFGL